MKISGPGQPAVPGADAAAPERVAKDAVTADPTASDPKVSKAGQAFAEKMSGPAPVRTTEVPAQRSAGAVAVQDLAAELEAGKLDSRAVLDKLIERVMGGHLGPHASPELRAQVQSALREAVESDPLLASKLAELED